MTVSRRAARVAARRLTFFMRESADQQNQCLIRLKRLMRRHQSNLLFTFRFCGLILMMTGGAKKIHIPCGSPNCLKSIMASIRNFENELNAARSATSARTLPRLRHVSGLANGLRFAAADAPVIPFGESKRKQITLYMSASAVVETLTN
jgi:hypothetical protein